MPPEIKQTQRVEQGLVLTPQLKKSLEILQASSLELSDIIAAELRTNPLLEDAAADGIAEKPQSVGESGDTYDDSDYDGADSPDPDGAKDENKRRDFALNSIPDKKSLGEYLLNEASLDAPNAEVAKAFAFLVGELDERGFLPREALERAEKDGFSKEDIDAALALLRESEPAGIGAFDMRDSLMLQLERKGLGGSLAHKILEFHYDLLVRRKVPEIAKAEGVTEENVEDAIGEIAKLNTSPAHEFSDDEEKYVEADIIYKKLPNGAWTAELADDSLPKLRINQEYRKMAASATLRADEAEYISAKLREGKFIIDAIEHRKQTLLKIAFAILSLQPEFFEKGKSALKPMTMQEVADIVGVHPTTVGRAVSEKYADTPFGIVALKSFFSAGYESAGGGEVASSSVKERIREIVRGESPRSPLSDSKIADILAAEGLNVARRTVAKYREELGIAPKNLRKRF